MLTDAARDPNAIYKADSHWCEQVRKTRQKLAGACSHCLHRRVRVETIDGKSYEGVIVGHDNTYLHLATGQNRFYGYGPYSAGFILPLVLFDLLAITLLI
ncbi:hypothetical protein SD71_06400 [Cohnella kolymensis]|uniref:Cellobiose phosphorylase n=1 Tax=Cohnella kolymensis TaxID=1590652 RepID=A0ABR5A771_9BACL|nr:hypothetical protein [Cohnella kolymensis]KIL36638.1 hypothetical protein SD71_06400 [Cohnella kolymensis]